MKQSFTDFEIIFVDNDSSDGSYPYVKDNFESEKIKVYITKTNLGFAGGNNFGYKYCSGDYIVLLNNDTVVEKDWLKNLLECISSDINTGIAQSLVITEGIHMKYYEKNGTINLLGHNIMEVFEINKNGTGEIFQANGCSLIMRKKLIDELNGLFPDEYFAYSEDTFLCFKVKFAGLKILHTSKSVVYHKGGGASKNRKPSFLYFYQERNRLLNFLIFFSGSFTIKYFPYLIFNFFLKLLASLFSGKYSAIQLARAYLWLLSNHRWIQNERKNLNSLKTVSDENVTKYLSGKILNGENIFEKFVNSISIFYCKLTGIRVMENQRSL
ncbi:MAG: glycosyltransferase family 2 protein [Bacteroidota bacterium]|nr:glycosyltransferase family 2 protein [Bacteroidota bacterium]